MIKQNEKAANAQPVQSDVKPTSTEQAADKPVTPKKIDYFLELGPVKGENSADSFKDTIESK